MRGNGKKIVYGILAVLCFALLAGMSYRKASEKHERELDALENKWTVSLREEYDMVVLGDSILGQIRDDTAIPAQVGKALGIKVYNGALGGTCMGRLEESEYAGDIQDALSMAGLSRAIVSGDFSVQNLVKLEENGTQHFPQVIKGLSEIDFSEVETLLIGYGANDYHAGEVIYPEEDSFDEYTYIGALRSTVEMLQNTYPDMRIVLLTPTYTWYPEQGLTCEEYERNGYVLSEYVNAEIEMAQELGIECIDIYHGFYSHDEWEDWQKYTADGLHPNEEGRNLIAQAIIEFFEEKPEKP